MAYEQLKANIKFFFGVSKDDFVNETYLREFDIKFADLLANANDLARATVIAGSTLESGLLASIEAQLYGEDIENLMVKEVRGIKLSYRQKQRMLYEKAYALVKDLEILMGIHAYYNKYERYVSTVSIRSA